MKLVGVSHQTSVASKVSQKLCLFKLDDYFNFIYCLLVLSSLAGIISDNNNTEH